MTSSVPTTRREALAGVDPAFRSVFLRIPGGRIKQGWSLRLIRRVGAAPTKVHPGVSARTVTVGGLSVTVHEPAGRTRPTGALLWLFGGGLISGAAAHVNDVASRFAADVGISVIVPDYRVAPEHPYPAAIDDAFITLQWMITRARSLGIDPDRLIIGGESAGGGLAAALAQRARDADIPIRLQLLIAPMLDDRTVQRAETAGRVTVAWTPASNRFGWTSYLGEPLGDGEERPYSVAARCEDLHGLAPAWISVGEIDLFHDEDVEYARRLREAGVPVELHTTPGAHHAFELIKPDHPRVRELHESRAAAMRAAVAEELES